MDFNSASSKTMHIDINSCFATIEQQANPFLRNKPVAVAAYATGNGCILAASYPAKYKGVKTGMRVKDARILCPNIIVLPPDPPKYRFVHKKMKTILERYSASVIPKSIDEFVINFDNKYSHLNNTSLIDIGLEIKQKIKKEIGEYITVSVGISTNRFLAKTAASYKKPDGLFEINKDNYLEVFNNLKLTDLCGIKNHNAARLSTVGIYTCLDFYNADVQKLKAGFRSVAGYYWFMRLHGYEVDDFNFERKSFGSQYALPRLASEAGLPGLIPILTKLVEKTSMRIRRHGYVTKGVHLVIIFRDHSYWHKSKRLLHPLFATSDIYKEFYKLLLVSPINTGGSVRLVSVTCFNLEKNLSLQLSLTTDILKKQNLTKALDKINNKFGDYTITPARIINNEEYVLDRIAFGVIDP